VGGREHRRTPFDGERGDIITSWLVQMLLVLAIIGTVIHEVVAIGVNRVTLDDLTRDVVREARQAGAGGAIEPARQAAESLASERGATVVDLRDEGGQLVVTLSRPARTLLVRRVGPLADLGDAEVTGRADWGA